MSVFRYMEMAVGSPSNRGRWHTSREVMTTPFKKENRFKEYWRSMFLYKTDSPSEGDEMFGNFYIESDEPVFSVQQAMMLDVVTFLEGKGVPKMSLDFFVTNRSIWLSVPAKVFGAFGHKALNEIYRGMATEVNEFLMGKGYNTGIDLSIYKWNGLIHSLGSHLPSSRAWVSKFGYGDLEMALSIEDLRESKYDNGTFFKELKVSTKANTWYEQKKRQLFRKGTVSKKAPIHFTSMKRLEERGLPETNRNLHIYSYSLYLKQCGLSYEEAVERVQGVFTDPYVRTRECLRTIRSAIEGNKHYNPRISKTFLDEELFEGIDETNGNQKQTFLIPRLFIERLQQARANHHVYRLLIQVLYTYQIEQSTYSFDMTGEKYKKDILSRFEKLAEAGIISYAVNGNHVSTKVIFHGKEVYRSHVVVERRFVENDLARLGKELPLLMEVWRGAYKVKEGVLYVATKLKTMAKRLRAKMATVRRLFVMLKQKGLVFRQFSFMEMGSREYQRKVREWMQGLRKQDLKPSTGITIQGGALFPSDSLGTSIMKCIYSLQSEKHGASNGTKGFWRSRGVPEAEVDIV